MLRQFMHRDLKMALFGQNAWVWLLAGVAAYIIFRLLPSSKQSPEANYEREIEHILTSEKHKVKGRFEE